MPTGRLLFTSPDHIGLVASLTGWLASHGADIVHAEQHTDEGEHRFFQRIEFRLHQFDLTRDEVGPSLAKMIDDPRVSWSVRYSDETRRVGILVSRQSHCLYDLLARSASGELDGEIAVVISNHPDHAGIVEHFGIPFHHLPVSGDNRVTQETEMIRILEEAGVELVVMARYMQVLTRRVLDRFPLRIINIHHSFLPAFSGGRPYRQAFERGVKLIGATAHYATPDLDEGPIIEQDTVRVSHRDDVSRLTSKGRDLETVVLARAVSAHLADRVMVAGRRTVVFT